MTELKHIAQLLQIMARLRDKQHGCPWDIEQDFATIAPYTIEEAYEVADAIARNDMPGLKEELGDLLLQVVFHAQMATEEKLFSFEDVARAIADKMTRRHPHVFESADIRTAAAQTENWEKIKEAERKDKQKYGVLADVPTALPALLRAQKLQGRAARVGFDWPDVQGVIGKIKEELAETEAAVASGNKKHIAEELGDLLFAVVNLARFMEADAESTLRDANAKFTRRFESIEAAAKAQSRQLQDLSLDEMEALWQQAKRRERDAA